MDHFPIIQALCRSAIADASPAVRKQVERLRDALKSDGESKQAASLSRILNSAERTKEFAPSRLARSRDQTQREELTPNTPIPVDRETSAPLAELLFTRQIQVDQPLFNEIVAAAVETIIEDRNSFEALSAVGIRPPNSLLIHGSPGTGKTHLALWIARKLELPTVSARLDGLISSFLGTTARNIGNLFKFANRHRCILLLDEFDAIAKLRDDPQEVGEIKRVVNALLQNLDSRGNEDFTIGITNHERLLDPAVWRRFEVQLEIPKPDFRMRAAIARQFLSPINAPASHVQLMAWASEGRTGSEIEMMVQTYKKFQVFHGRDKGGAIDALRRFATLNSARVDARRSRILLGHSFDLMYAMKTDPDLGFTVSDIGEIVGQSSSTVSRQFKKHAVSTAETRDSASNCA